MRVVWTSVHRGKQLDDARHGGGGNAGTTIVGPPLAAGLASWSPLAAVAATGSMAVCGALAYATAPLVRGVRGRAGEARRVPPWLRRAAPPLALGCLAAMSLGALQLLVPAYSIHHGSAAWSGPLLAVYAAGATVGGLLYGARTRGAPLAAVLGAICVS